MKDREFFIQTERQTANVITFVTGGTWRICIKQHVRCHTPDKDGKIIKLNIIFISLLEYKAKHVLDSTVQYARIKCYIIFQTNVFE